MEAMLKSNSYSCYDKVFSQVLHREESQESIVPDRLPDIVSVISAGGPALIRSKDVGEGKIRLEANVPVRVSYYSESGDISCLDVNIPFYLSVENADIPQGGICVVGLTLIEISARIQNPRKLCITASIDIALDCYDKRETVFAESPQEDPCSIHALTHTADVSYVGMVSEKTFVLTDEFLLEEESTPIEEILEQSVRLETGEFQHVGTKLILKGTAFSRILYRSALMAIDTAEFATQFSQIFETEDGQAASTADAVLLLSGAYFDIAPGYDGRTVQMELHAVVQTRAYITDQVPYLAEAYSNRYALSLRRESREICCVRRAVEMRESLREQIDLAPEVTEAVLYHADVLGTEVNESALSVRFGLKILAKREDGRCFILSRNASVRFKGDSDSDGAALRISSIRIEDAHMTASGNHAEVRLNVTAVAQIIEEGELTCIQGISYDESAPLDLSNRPSLVIMKASSSDDLWSIARDNCSSVEAIEAANELDRSGAAWEKLILIPRSI